MEVTMMLDKVAAAVERILKDARSTATTRRMDPEAFLAHALSEVKKASAEAPERAVARLAALGRAVDVAKQAFVDRASEEVEVQVFEEETTAAADESEKEVSPVAAEAALGNAAFASNPEELHKALERVGKELEVLRGGTKKAGDGTKSKSAEVAKADHVAWPADMNTRQFREGVKKAEDAPTWGKDPDAVRDPEA